MADLILGHTPVWAVELDPYCCAVLRARFPSVQVIEGDVCHVDFGTLAPIDALCAGFPCQDISTANPDSKGLEGSKSSLFFEICRAIDTLRPTWVFLENSPAIRSRGRERIVAELLARGYAWRDGTLAASDVGAPHRRLRWWLLARRADADDPRKLQSERTDTEERQRAGNLDWWASEPPVGRMADGVAHRAHRLTALGNGQVPLCAAAAWILLGGPWQ